MNRTIDVIARVRRKIALRARLRRLADQQKFHALYRKYRFATMIPRRIFVLNLTAASETLGLLSSGAVVECGTWRGGMSAALTELSPEREFYFFDSFDGLPPAGELDGPVAPQWQKDGENYNNCSASIEEFSSTISLSPAKNIKIVKGLFQNTLPGFEPPPIAVLRLDADWYDSTMICLQTFWDHILPEGIILIDDYYWWEGCSRAVHDFLSSRKASERIEQLSAGLAVIRKGHHFGFSLNPR